MRKFRAVQPFIPLLLFIPIGGLLALGAESLRSQAPPAQQPAPVKNEDCAICHEDLVNAFRSTPHNAIETSSRYARENSCESCHGSGQAHVDADGDPAKILSFKGPAVKTLDGQCVACHEKSHELAGYSVGIHARSGVSCADCHSAHAPARLTLSLKESANALCMSCHVEQRTEFSRPYHHRVLENSMRCVDCHQPHGGMESKLTRRSLSGEAACLTCHNDKKGPFVFEHASLRLRDCQSCHQPHGSNNPKMLVRATVQSLCLECHSTSTDVFTRQPPAFHDVRSPRFQNCTTCHIRIHGSNSSRLFLR